MKPKTIADHLLIPINSFKKNLAKIDTKKGQEKNRAFAVATVSYTHLTLPTILLV